VTESVSEIPSPDPADLHRLKECLEALDDRKAENLRVLDVRGQSSVTDYLILATGNSAPHLRALRVVAEKALKEESDAFHGVDNVPESGWLVVDAYDIMVHLFTQEMRDNYRLEALWKDAVELKV